MKRRIRRDISTTEANAMNYRGRARDATQCLADPVYNETVTVLSIAKR